MYTREEVDTIRASIEEASCKVIPPILAPDFDGDTQNLIFVTHNGSTMIMHLDGSIDITASDIEWYAPAGVIRGRVRRFVDENVSNYDNAMKIIENFD